MTDTPSDARGSELTGDGWNRSRYLRTTCSPPSGEMKWAKQCGPAELGGDVTAVVGRAEQPELGHGRAGRRGADFTVLVIGREIVGEPAVEVEELLGEVIDAERARSVDERSGGAARLSRGARPTPRSMRPGNWVVMVRKFSATLSEL